MFFRTQAGHDAEGRQSYESAQTPWQTDLLNGTARVRRSPLGDPVPFSAYRRLPEPGQLRRQAAQPVAGPTGRSVPAVPSSSFDKKLEADHLFEIQLREPITGIESMAAEDGAEQGFAAMIINNHFHASSNVAIGSTDVKQSVKPPAKGDVEGLVYFLQETGLTPELLTELRAAAKADEEVQGEGPGRWARVRGWF